MKPQPGTYAVVFQNHITEKIQIGRWRTITVEPGYYIYVGSAFGPGGIKSRVSRHLRANNSKHWHIDYLYEFVHPIAVWISYKSDKLEHHWAQILLDRDETSPIQGFGCSDCKCFTHLFHTHITPDSAWIGQSELVVLGVQPVP